MAESKRWQRQIQVKEDAEKNDVFFEYDSFVASRLLRRDLEAIKSEYIEKLISSALCILLFIYFFSIFFYLWINYMVRILLLF